MSNFENIKSINTQTAPTKNQITSNKPSIIKNSNVLDGYFTNSLNGGHIKTIAYAPIMAGTKVMDYKIRCNIGTLTPKTPNYQQLKAVIKTYFVPNSRVWEDAEKFTAQKSNGTEQQVKSEPNFGDYKIATFYNFEGNKVFNIVDSDYWRDSWVSSYIPRFQMGKTGTVDNTVNKITLPRYSVLPIRGFRAIYNDFERNKEYDEPLREFKGTYYTEEEHENTIPNFIKARTAPSGSVNYNEGGFNQFDKFVIRGKRQNSYYTDYRTELLGEGEIGPDISSGSANALVTLVEWEKSLAERRASAENAQKNDWDIIAEIRGSKKATQGKVQLLGTKTIPLNYQFVAQDTYNTNEKIEENFQTLGAIGAYSYTEIDTSMFQMQEFIEEGYIHTIIQITADTVFETGFDRMGLNVDYMNKYRPELKDQKHDVLYNIEKQGTHIMNSQFKTEIAGFKRKFSEYFKLPNSIAGDLTTAGYILTDPENFNGKGASGNVRYTDTLIQSKRTFQMFETGDHYTGRLEPKNIWQDYTDIEFNRNQAIMQDVSVREDNETGKSSLWVRGENQFYLMGMQTMIADLPIDENIKNNYTTWGEL